MSAIPKKAIKFLELESIPLNKLGIPNPRTDQDSPEKSSDAKPKTLLGLFKTKQKSVKTSGKIQSMHDMRAREYQVDVAAWLRFGLSDEQRLASLCICYTDGKGEFVEIVEEQEVQNSASAMLSGRVKILAKGPVTRVRVGCAGLKAEDRCYVEDITVTVPSLESKIA
jgi:hypothetical protein